MALILGEASPPPPLFFISVYSVVDVLIFRSGLSCRQLLTESLWCLKELERSCLSIQIILSDRVFVFEKASEFVNDFKSVFQFYAIICFWVSVIPALWCWKLCLWIAAWSRTRVMWYPCYSMYWDIIPWNAEIHKEGPDSNLETAEARALCKSEGEQGILIKMMCEWVFQCVINVNANIY